MNNNNSVPFHKAGREYVEKLIRIRETLIKTGKNLSPLASTIAGELKKLLNFWKYETSEKMASFLYRHAAEIQYLIPGEDSNSHQTLFEEFNQLYNVSEKILNHEPVC